MEEWLRSMAVGLAVLTGLVIPAQGLRLESSALKTPQAVLVTAELSGGLSPAARDYLLAGNTLTLRWVATWGDRSVSASRSITYHAWDRVFAVTDSQGTVLETADQSRALTEWQTWPPTKLGTREALSSALATTLTVAVSLPSEQESLWGYQKVSLSLRYPTWAEIPQ
ncbi:MAG: hypothetical protein WCG80_10620 [Spirochaetales bacterium]